MAREKKKEKVYRSEIRVDAGALQSAEAGYVSQHIEARLSRPQGVLLQELTVGLSAAGAKLRDGRFVRDRASALRYILESFQANPPDKR